MKREFFKRQLSLILCVMLSAALALAAAGCSNSSDKDSPAASASEQDDSSGAETEDASASSEEQESAPQADDHVVGEGSTQFDFAVTDQDGNETLFEVHTDKETVGEALQELDLIDGDESEYGLYVKTVDGITADYDKDGVYWAFYINGEYAQTGVDSTEIKEGDSYAFKVEKG